MPGFDLKSVIEAVAESLGHLGQESSEARHELWQKTQAFALRLLGSATTRWIPFYAERRPCHVHTLRAGVPFPCSSFAILHCDACGKPACMDHAQVDSHGHGTCAACLVEIITQKRGAAAGPRQPPAQAADPQKIVEAALKTLGLKPGASWAEIHAAHRKLAAQHHPDRVKTASAKEKATKRSMAVNSALATLKQHYTVKGVA